MSCARFTILLLVVLAFFAPSAWGQLGEGLGDRGSGRMVPEKGKDGDALQKIFQDGVDYLAEGECDRAEEKFEKVLDKVPRNSQTNYLRGIALQCMRRYEVSIRYFRRAKRDDSEYYQAYGALGISYLALDDADRARRELEELSKYKRMCEQGNLRCPPELLKAYKKLATAIERAEGSVEGPS